MGAVSRILVRETHSEGVAVLTVDGVLNSATYRGMRDRIIKAALQQPRAVIVDMSALRVPAPSAYAVFTSARWQISRWPDVPVMLVCAHSTGREALHRQGVTRSVPVHDSLDAAVVAAAANHDAGHRSRRRRCAELAREPESITLARDLVTEWLSDWGHSDKISPARIITAELVRNVHNHTESAAVLCVEADTHSVTIAVSDGSGRMAARIESTYETFRLSGLHLVAALANAWGCAPSSDGKTVWATIAG